MDVTKQEDLITRSRQEYEHYDGLAENNKTPLYNRAVKYGIPAGLLTGAFVMLDGFYIMGNGSIAGFAKYLILAAFLGILLNRSKMATPEGSTFKTGISVGMLTSAVAAIVMAIMSLIDSFYMGAETVSSYFGDQASLSFNAWTLAGVTFFEGIVAGMILTFIWLQLLKDRSRAS